MLSNHTVSTLISGITVKGGKPPHVGFPAPAHSSPCLSSLRERSQISGTVGSVLGGVGGEGEAGSLLHLSGGLALASKGVACAARVLRGSP